jgi:P4 family phage/plasmid primase-like protien
MPPRKKWGRDMLAGQPPTSVSEAALFYANLGHTVFPAPVGEKKSHKSKKHSNGANWGATADPAEIQNDFIRWPDANIGLPTGAGTGFFVVEADTLAGHDVDGIAALAALQEKHGALPPTRVARSPSGSEHYYFKIPEGVTIKNSASEIAPGVDVRGEGGMVIAPPSVKPGRGEYVWVNWQPIAEAPPWLVDLCKSEPRKKLNGVGTSAEQQADPVLIAKALAVIPNKDLGWEEWNKIGMATWAATGGSEAGLAAFDKWSQKSAKYKLEASHERWNNFLTSPPDEIGAGTLFWLADQASPGWRDIIVSDRDHVARARRMRDVRRPHLLHYRDDFMDFAGGAYRIVDDGVMNADMWTFLDKANAWRKVGTGKAVVDMLMPFRPDRTSVAETIAALKSVVHLNPDTEAPCWLDGRKGLAPNELISFPNGMLDLRDNKFYPADPAFFTTAALGFDYVTREEAAPKHTEWLKFLDSIYEGPDRENEIRALQEMFGYLLTSDTSQEKAFLFLGPKRSGKGTMLGMMQKLIPRTAIAGPALKSLGTNFGLAPLIGKQIAIIDDLRVGSPKDQDVLIENLLKITGRGYFTIDRKFKSSWSGSLPVKLVLVSNVMPKLGDDSAALASRLIISTTQVSFYGKENPRLLEDLLAPELLGIFHWALEGLLRLRKRGHFEETKASKEAGERLANLGSPARAFIAERCKIERDASIPKRKLYEVWREYARENDLFTGTMEKFCEALYSAAGGVVKSGKLGKDGERVPSCIGIRLRSTADKADDDAAEATVEKPTTPNAMVEGAHDKPETINPLGIEM